jgi:hypothetical protein
MFRYEVPVGPPVVIRLTGNPVAVAALPFCSGMEFWAEHDDDPGFARAFTVIGTGHPIPEGAVYRGTAPRTPEGIVFHLYELPGWPS